MGPFGTERAVSTPAGISPPSVFFYFLMLFRPGFFRIMLAASTAAVDVVGQLDIVSRSTS